MEIDKIEQIRQEKLMAKEKQEQLKLSQMAEQKRLNLLHGPKRYANFERIRIAKEKVVRDNSFSYNEVNL